MTEPDSVERYLDDLFDRLSGTGGAGRRALAEAEEHLRDDVAEAVSRGVPADLAAREAVARFGRAADLARRLRRANRSHRALALSSGWLVAGWASAIVALSFLLTAVDRLVELRRTPGNAVECASTTCPTQTQALEHYLALTVGFGLLGAGLLLARRVVRPVPVPAALPILTAVVSALLTPVFLFGALSPVLSDLNLLVGSAGIYFTLFVGVVLGAATLASAGWAIAVRRRPAVAAG
ncbi:hypothetical protein [Actinocatenispora comari]|jgi:hypothetical protein|uniref:Uncharacterized protein n=1 Tax=Actinocatenispora comari TaxID=2807577 RepID=A0A8J4AF13_9ACTN|nr:hypothetical protein [Actinocatenispora comari]GIL28512.1 hypothetical protein NUM_37660 [Actinocatenispora comari]